MLELCKKLLRETEKQNDILDFWLLERQQKARRAESAVRRAELRSRIEQLKATRAA